ncbi:MAG: alanine racemase [Myxococcales bacterium]|nr:alanine racemase [Myxococcales bacterium]
MRPDFPRPLRPRATTVDESLRATRAEVSLDAIAHNLGVVRRAAHGRKVLAVVKADAYGHGVVPVAQRLQAEGVDGFGVALAEEGIELREAGIDRAILVLNGISGGAHRDIIASGLTPVLYEISEASEFDAVSGGRPIDVHLKIDTGMGRLGVPLHEVSNFLRDLRRFPSIRIVGLMTHLSTADSDPDYVAEQVAAFSQAHGLVRRFGHEPVVLHAANSAALFRHPEVHFDWVRPGLALYGYPGSDTIDAPLRPAMRWRTEILRLRTLHAGESAGYGRSFRAASETRLATIPVGYGDGLLRSASNRGHVLIHGTRCPIVGNIAMDLTTVDVSKIANVGIGDEALLLGEQDGAVLDARDLATAAGTIPYEVLTNVSRRVPRIYLNE